jgi:hypothetical protein
MGRVGFPLDDAWIHQTYARNLGLRGEWAFIPGQPSAGSTAPLWSGLLAIGHAMQMGPYLWTYFLGCALLAGLSLIGAWAFQVYAPMKAGWAPWVGLLLVFEWHLVWASASGMETLLFALLVLLVLSRLAAGRGRWFGLGLLIGLSAWVRPDGITLLGPAVLTLALAQSPFRRQTTGDGRPTTGDISPIPTVVRPHSAFVVRLPSFVFRRSYLPLFLGFTALFAPYLLFNRLLAGAWWPNTFYAKQAEYAALQGIPLVKRYIDQLGPLLQGVGIILLPGFILFVWNAFRKRAWRELAGAIWIAGYLGLYAWRLPVAYQHGRYLIPVLPAYLVMGAAGLAGWLRPRAPFMLARVVSRAWVISTAALAAVYWITGAAAYGGDVAFVESEMVPAARWVAANTDEQALVAAHDIGALGYFASRPLLDLAGLISPEVIPFIRDEAQLEKYLDEEGASYLVTFPGWYPDLVKKGSLIYQTQGVFSPRSGGENMMVYRWGTR